MQQLKNVFQTQKRNNLTVKSNTYYTESDAERRPSEWRNTATSGHRKKINKYDREATYWISSETAREICTNKKKASYINQFEWLVIQCCLALKKEEFQKGIERSKFKTSLKLMTWWHVRLYQSFVEKMRWYIFGTYNTINEPSKVVFGKLLDLNLLKILYR